MFQKKYKWLSSLTAFVYLIYAYKQVVGITPDIYDYFTLLGNWMVITVIVLWIIYKSTVKTLFEFAVLCAFILYLFVLHQLVSYVNIGYYFTSINTGDYHMLVERINLVPFRTLYRTISSPISASTIIQILGNALLLTPLPFALLTLKITKKQTYTAFISIAVSFGIELYQFMFNITISSFEHTDGRSVDIDDLILNSLSVVLGLALYKLFIKVTSSIMN